MSHIKKPVAQVLDKITLITFENKHTEQWFEENQKSFEGALKSSEHIDPNKVLVYIEPVSYKSTIKHVETGKTENINDFEYHETTPSRTGFVLPRFAFSKQLLSSELYKKTLSKLGLKEGEYVPSEKIGLIEESLSAYNSQLDRQYTEITIIHSNIFSTLSRLLSQSEQRLFKNIQNASSKSKSVKLPSNWDRLYKDFHDVFNEIQSKRQPGNRGIADILNRLEDNPYVDNSHSEDVFQEIITQCDIRAPFLEQAEQLVRKILPLVSIKEDYLTDQKIKNSYSLTNKKMPDPAKIAQRIADRNKNRKGSNVQLITETLTNLRSYLIRNDIKNIKNRVNGIVTYLISKTKALKETQRTTCRKWVKVYFEAYIEDQSSD